MNFYSKYLFNILKWENPHFLSLGLSTTVSPTADKLETDRMLLLWDTDVRGRRGSDDTNSSVVIWSRTQAVVCEINLSDVSTFYLQLIKSVFVWKLRFDARRPDWTYAYCRCLRCLHSTKCFSVRRLDKRTVTRHHDE